MQQVRTRERKNAGRRNARAATLVRNFQGLHDPLGIYTARKSLLVNWL